MKTKEEAQEVTRILDSLTKGPLGATAEELIRELVEAFGGVREIAQLIKRLYDKLPETSATRIKIMDLLLRAMLKIPAPDYSNMSEDELQTIVDECQRGIVSAGGAAR